MVVVVKDIRCKHVHNNINLLECPPPDETREGICLILVDFEMRLLDEHLSIILSFIQGCFLRRIRGGIVVAPRARGRELHIGHDDII